MIGYKDDFFFLLKNMNKLQKYFYK